MFFVLIWFLLLWILFLYESIAHNGVSWTWTGINSLEVKCLKIFYFFHLSLCRRVCMYMACLLMEQPGTVRTASWLNRHRRLCSRFSRLSMCTQSTIPVRKIHVFTCVQFTRSHDVPTWRTSRRYGYARHRIPTIGSCAVLPCYVISNNRL